MQAAGYVRVSSASQTSVMQVNAIREAAEARGDTIEHCYADSLSGKTMARPGLEELRAHVRAGKVRKIYVFRLDRLTRSGIRDTLGLVDELRENGCELVTIADSFNFAGEGAEIVLAVLAWAAKVERLAIGERISAARARLEANGGAWGRPKRMAGDEVKRARAMLEKGKTIREISVALKIPKSTISRAVTLSQKPMAKAWRPGALKRKGKQGGAQ